MPVFDFKNASKESSFECTYTTFSSDNKTASPEHPIFVLDNSEHNWAAETIGMFANPYKKTAFEFQTDDGNILSNIIKVDARFTSLIKWLGENRIKVKLSGKNVEDGYAVYRIREIAFNNSQKLSSEDGFLQYMIERLLDSSIVAQDIPDDELDESGDSMKLTSITSISDFLNCAGITLPDNIRLWARRNLAVARSSEVTPEEKRHAQRALSIMLNIQWKSNYFESIDPVEARRILDEELFGMESVKQRIIETVIQINRTHTLPSYGILLVGPAGTGKSQIAYLVAKILKMPWTTLDMSLSMMPNSLQEVQEYTLMPSLVLLWKHLTTLVNLILYSSSTSLIRQLQATAMRTLPMYYLHCLITLDLQIIIWNVLFLHLVYIQLQLLTTRNRLVLHCFQDLQLLIFQITPEKKRRLYLSSSLFLRY